MMNPDTNKLEPLFDASDLEERGKTLRELIEGTTAQLVRADGSPMPSHWCTFHVGELLVLKNYTFRVAHISESTLLLEPVKPEDALEQPTDG